MPSPPTPGALVLTAGLGTRLHPLTLDRAKASLPVAGEALVRRILRWLRQQGITEVMLNLHHRPESIARLVGDASDLRLRVRYSWEPVLLGSAGGPRRAMEVLGAERLLVVNGDTLTDLDISGMVAVHLDSGAMVTMALIDHPAPTAYGGVDVDTDGWIRSFPGPAARTEGPASRQSPGGAYHFIGVQLVEARALAELPADQPAETVRGLYPSLIAQQPHAIRAFPCDAAFHDIGNPEDYLAANLALARIEGSPLVAADVRIDATATVVRSVVWNGVEVGPHATIEECVLGDGVRIPEGARIERSVIVRATGRRPEGMEQPMGHLLVAPLAQLPRHG